MATSPTRPPANRATSKAARAAARRAAERRAQRTRSLVMWGIGGLLAVAVLGLVLLGGGHGGRASEPVDPALVALAEENAGSSVAGSSVQVYQGSRHVVYHATEPLPTAGAPSQDGRPALVWSSGTWCEFCERMEPFANDVAARFSDRLRFVEKSVDHDRGAAARHGVRGTPTFVLIDASGNELGRFFYQRDEGTFARAIEVALAATGA